MNKTFEQGKDDISKLTEYFHKNRSAYLAPVIKEAQVRQNLIDPLFEALGWDVRNNDRVAPQYREVVVEKSMDVEGQRKAPDYSFRVGTMTRFYAEAKKCGVNIHKDPLPAFQLRRYAWSSKLSLSILTDFEEFSVYDCSKRPKRSDKVSQGRIKYLSYEEYPDKWREIWDIFSHEAVWSGSFDQFTQSKRGRRGSTEVDAEFLREIEGWRDVLARNIALRNPGLSIDDMNRGIQLIIDRIIFLRMAEDRGLEIYETLMNISETDHIYRKFVKDLCAKADAKYNSGLFDLKADKIFNDIAVDDKVLKPILQSLYLEHGSPYEFSAIPVEILGTVYERFLGRTITLTKGHRAKIEEKPEVRKAGGVYYTPSYIVDYIVKNTVGKMIEGKSPQELRGEKRGKDAHPLRVLDMACGSGSFLLGAYQCLMEYYLKWYSENKPEKYKDGVYQKPLKTGEAQWQLTIGEKKRILTTHIFGVDIDRQAVEVTKLSLLLKVLEGEDDESLGKQLDLFAGIDRALPNLTENIKCGNSLIGTDYFTGTIPPDPEEMKLINPFDWNMEFPEAVKQGGFDCVIGNPPYIRIQTMKEWAPKEVEIYKELFHAASVGNYDIYVVFIEKGLNLLNPQGKLGFICPHKFFNSKYGASIRSVISEEHHLSHVVHFSDQQIFEGATTYTCLLFLDKSPCQECQFVKVDDLNEWRINGVGEKVEIAFDKISDKEWNFLTGKGANILNRINEIPTRLGDIAEIFVGLQTSADKIYVVSIDIDIEKELTKPFLLTGNLSAYSPAKPSAKLIFPYKIREGKAELIAPEILNKLYPKGWAYLNKHQEELSKREKGKMGRNMWYAFGRSQNLSKMDSVKLIIQVTAKRPTVLYDDFGLYMTGGGSGPFYGVRPKNESTPIKYLLGIMNSSIFSWMARNQSTNLRGGYIKFSKQYIENIPIVLPAKNEYTNKSFDRIVKLVDSMLTLHKQISTSNSIYQKEILQRQINSTDAEIDRLVYELYGLNEKEIAIVEEETK